jgi:hypothetical protein
VYPGAVPLNDHIKITTERWIPQMHWRGPSGLYFCDHRKRIWSLFSVCHVSLKNLNGSKSNIRLTGIVQPMPRNSHSALALTAESFFLIFCPFDFLTFKYCSLKLALLPNPVAGKRLLKDS